jgi:hypothetical protein
MARTFGRRGMDSGSRLAATSAGCHEHSNEPAASIKRQKMPCEAEQLLDSPDEVSSASILKFGHNSLLPHPSQFNNYSFDAIYFLTPPSNKS